MGIFYCFGLIFSGRKFSFKYKFFGMSETAEIAENQRKKKQRKLSHDELLRLLSVFEGELQARDQAIAILKQQVRQANTAREALKRDDKYINASDDEKSGNSVGQLKSIIEHQKDSLRKVKREMCHAEQKHTQLLEELEREKHKHHEYMEKETTGGRLPIPVPNREILTGVPRSKSRGREAQRK